MESIAETSTYHFIDLYKYTSKNLALSQQERRAQLLEKQKEKRHKITDERRQLNDSKEQDDNGEVECNIDQSINSERKERGTKFKLMLSEWFTEIPDDLEDMWLVKFAPEGFRVLLMAKKGYTICYTKEGRFYSKFKSNFPGGSRDSPIHTTVLDCIYNNHTETFFILDCLFWNSMSMLDSEASFRFFWLKSKFNESPELTQSQNKYKFVLLDFFPAQRLLIQEIMLNQLEIEGYNYSYDGIVFYHKESHYMSGHTPLVGWLASYMLPEKLHIDVPHENMVRKPKNYACMEAYLEELSRKRKKNKSKKGSSEDSMDVL